jgi:hypothetical protein
MKVSGGNSPGRSKYYSKRLDAAIRSKGVITIGIAQTFKPLGRAPVDVDRSFGGGGTYTNPITRAEDVVISGNSYVGLRDAKGNSLRDTPADILAHELVGHAIPKIVGSDTGNAIDNENKVRREVQDGSERERGDDPEF